MIIAIDESGTFSPEATHYSVFVAVQFRQRRSAYRAKQQDFTRWKSTIPGTFKNSRGEIKGAALTDEQLETFVRDVVRPWHNLWITPYLFRPSDNQSSVVDVHREHIVNEIEKGIEGYVGSGNKRMANDYNELKNWIRRLNYQQFTKAIVLGHCIGRALSNAFGISIVGKYDDELARLRFLIDRDFVREPRPNEFWRELLRNQINDITSKEPVPIRHNWVRRGHPVFQRYTRDGQLDFNELFWDNLSFVLSHEHFEIQVADIVATIVARRFNRQGCRTTYKLLLPCIARKQRITKIRFSDLSMNPEVESQEE